jgi:AcrR family transcriptional regulator
MPKIVDHDERREFIARVSAEIIAEQGLEQATIREIAARTGFSKGIIEHYFDDKDHLIGMALDWVNERYSQREQRATAGKQGLAALHARLCCVLPLTREAQQEWKIRLRFWSLAAIHADLQAAQSQRLKATRQRFQRDIEQAQGLGEIHAEVDAVVTANRLAHLVSGVSCHALIAPGFYHKRYLKTVADEVVEELRQCSGQKTPQLHAAPGVRSSLFE